MPQIPNEQLAPRDVPSADADWDTIQRFALTFNGYRVHGFDRCAKIANQRRHDSLTDLRTCLFFEQRRWRHFSRDPDEAEMAYIRSLVEKMRQRVAAIQPND